MMEMIACGDGQATLSDYSVFSTATVKVLIKGMVSYSLDTFKDSLPRIEINCTGTAKDWMQLGLGVGEIALGTAGLFGSGALEVATAGGATPVVAGTVLSSAALAEVSAITAFNAVGNLVDVNVYKGQGNSSGGEVVKKIILRN